MTMGASTNQPVGCPSGRRAGTPVNRRDIYAIGRKTRRDATGRLGWPGEVQDGEGAMRTIVAIVASLLVVGAALPSEEAFARAGSRVATGFHAGTGFKGFRGFHRPVTRFRAQVSPVPTFRTFAGPRFHHAPVGAFAGPHARSLAFRHHRVIRGFGLP